MKTKETQALDLVNVGIGILKASQEQFEKMALDAKKAVEDLGKNAEKAIEGFKVRGALDHSEQSVKARELAVSVSKKLG